MTAVQSCPSPQASGAYLVNDRGETIAIPEKGVLLGKSPESTVRLNGRGIAPLHARIYRAALAYVLQSLDEHVPIVVNGRPVVELWLRDGDQILFGETPWIFHKDLAPRPAAPAGVAATEAQNTEPTAETPAAPPIMDILASLPAGLDPLASAPPEDQEGLTREVHRLRIALAFSRSISLAASERELYDAILSESFDLLPADHGAVLVIDGEALPRIAAQRRRRPDDAPEVFVSHTALALAIRERQGLLVNDVAAHGGLREAQSVVEADIRSVLCVPLQTGGRVLGAIHLDTRGHTGGFTSAGLEVLGVVAAQAAVALENFRLREARQEEIRVRRELARFLAPQVVEQILRSREAMPRGGQQVRAAILFLDIRNFSGVIQREPPAAVVSLLNDFFTAMADIVFAHNGLLDKFLGDGLMAIWGVPFAQEEPVAKAISCALQMQNALDEFNRKRRALGLFSVRAGCGIEAGEVVGGNIGSERRLEYTVIGEPVNVASRLCQQAAPGEILIGEQARKMADDRFKYLPRPILQLKGLAQGIRPYRVESRRGSNGGSLPEVS